MTIEEVDIDPPRRDEEHRHPCFCVLTYPDKPEARAECRGTAFDPDSPLCHACVEAGHDALPHLPYAEVMRDRDVAGLGRA
jgi:hypothetical protein